MMIHTLDQGMINTDHVRQVISRWDTKRKTWVLVFHISEDEAIVAEMGPVYDPSSLSQLIVPAQPGFTQLAYYAGEKEFVDRVPVIAWRIDSTLGEFHQAVALESPASNAIGSAILCPDGQVFNPGNQSWPSEESWLEEMREEVREKNDEKVTA